MERYVVRPMWQVVSVESDGREIIVDTVPDEAAARAKADSLTREAERLERAAQSFPQNRRDRDR